MQEKIIICSGDSYTAGIETAADKYIPGYTGLITDIRSLDQTHKNVFDKLCKILRKLDVKEYFQYEDECKKSSWPSYLKKLSGTKVLNISSGGLSNHEIVHRTVKTYLSLLNKKVKPDEIIVLCMLSSPSRIGYPQYSKRFCGEYNFQSFMNGYAVELPDRSSAVRDWYSSHKDWDMMWSSYSVVQALRSLITFHGSRIYFFDSGLIELFRISANVDKAEKQHFENIINSINLSLKFTDVLYGELPMSKLPGAHPTADGHKIFARKVWNLISSEKKD